MERPAIYNRWPQPVVDKAFMKYPPHYEIIQHGATLDHTGEDMSDYYEDIYESSRIAYIKGFMDGWNRDLNTKEDESK